MTDTSSSEQATQPAPSASRFDAGIVTEGRFTAHEFVRATLRRAIVRGELRAGARLIQADIAAELDVSTTPVREALRDLATEGLITLDRHRGGIVRGLDWDDMHEIAMIHELLEVKAIYLTTENITSAELDRAEVYYEKMSAEEDPTVWVELNREFHNIFHDATRLPRLAGIMRSLQEGSTIYIGQAQRLNPEIRRKAQADHRALIEACRNRDGDAALRIQLQHFKIPLRMTEEIRRED